MGTGSFFLVGGGEQQGYDVAHPPYLSPMLNKEYSYTSTPPLNFMACSTANFVFTV